MKMILIAFAMLATTLTSAKTINYDVFKTQQTVESISLDTMKIFDFKLKKVTASKTITSKRCNHTGPRRDWPTTNCDIVTTTQIEVAQVILGYRPTGTTDRRGEVTNGKTMEFVSFNVALNELSEETLAVLNTKRGLFTSKKKFVRLANELFEVSSYRTGHRTHLVSIIRK
jgi:hypothetical protein